MGIFDRLFNKESDLRPQRGGELPETDINELFKLLDPWSTGKRLADADPRYSDVVGQLPLQEGTSLRLSSSPGTFTLSGVNSRIFGYPGTIELNMPTLTSIAGLGRILLDLGYSGIEEEAAAIQQETLLSSFRFAVSGYSESSYPLLRLQISFTGGLRDPLHLEVLSDILDRNVQDFYRILCDVGRYELSVHIQRRHLASALCIIDERQKGSLAGTLKTAVSHMLSISPDRRNMAQAVRSFERRHPLGEGMLQ